MADNVKILEALVRGPHDKGKVRREIAALLRRPLEDVGWAESPGDRRFVLDHHCREDGFRTQVTLRLDLDSGAPVKTDLDLARALAGRFNEDALVLADPTVKGEPFHGLLARPDGRVYRVPLDELESGGMGIDENAGTWREWILRA